jgi:four helix bundle protein
VRDHKRLKAFYAADELALLVYRVTPGFPREEQSGLTSQMRRAAVSVPSNIVEGCARPTETDYSRFLGTSFASLQELQYRGSLANRLGYLRDESYWAFDSRCTEVSKMLAALIRSLRKARSVAVRMAGGRDA